MKIRFLDRRPVWRAFAAGVCLALAAGPGAFIASAASSASWEMGTYRDFVSGRFQGVSLTRDGRLTLAARIDAVFASDQPIIWSVVQAPDGSIYAGTGHRGRIYRIDKSGRAELFWTSDQPEVFALAMHPDGTLYAATSPDGKIYRFRGGKAEEYFAPGVKYIWSLAFSQDGALYAGTGNQGKVFRIAGPGKGEVYYETGQSHVTAVTVDGSGRVIAGSEPNGIIYRISAKDKAFVLYDAMLPEIRSLAPAPDGSIYVAALGGSIARRSAGSYQTTPGAAGAVTVTGTSTTVTVNEDMTQGGADLNPKPDAAKPAATPAPAPVAAVPVIDIAGVEKSAVYRIAPDNTVETLWSSKEENAYDLLLAGSRLVFSTDVEGRIYELDRDRRLTLLTQTNEGETTRLLATRSGLLAATGDMGKLFRLMDSAVASGSYESPVHDVGTVARWGRISWRGEDLSAGKLLFRTRTGNSARPDKTWSEWSKPLTEAEGSLVPSPNARYIQWKAELASSGAAVPVLDHVTVAYLPQNTAPVLRAVTVVPQVAAASGGAKPAQQSAAAATYSITVTDSGEAGPSTSSGTPTQSVSRSTAEQLLITWQVEDAEGDRMVYDLSFRGEGEREWKLLKGRLNENTHTVDADVLADGTYTFRVMASDSPSNSPTSARQTELESAPVLVDRTPPLLTAGSPSRSGPGIEIEFDAKDTASALRRCEYSLDAGSWVPLDAEDGVIDSQQEKFTVRLDNLSPGEHLVVVRVYDAANNAGLGKVVLRF